MGDGRKHAFGNATGNGIRSNREEKANEDSSGDACWWPEWKLRRDAASEERISKYSKGFTESGQRSAARASAGEGRVGGRTWP